MLPTEKLVGNEDERAVSPVIGVILMVAITVILAAVIAAFVLDIGDTGEPVQANLDISESPDGDIEFTMTNVDAVDEIQLRGCDDDDDDIGDIGITDDNNAEWVIDDGNGQNASLSVGSTGFIESGETSLDGPGDDDDDDADIDDCSGTDFNVVGINDGSESIIKSFDYEGSSD